MENSVEWTKNKETSYLISVSDIMMGLLFIFIIILVYFALTAQKSQLQADKAITKTQQAEIEAVKAKSRALKAETVARIAVKKLSNSIQTRSQLLNSIQTKLLDNNVQIIVDYKNGILRLPEGTVSFKHGSIDFQDESSKQNLKKFANTIAEILPCYLTKFRADDCPEVSHYLESLFIEGHTDTTGDENINWLLSIERALKAYWFITNEEPVFKKYTNEMGQPLLSISGYGECRPLPRRPDILSRDYNRMNRRIDFRFLMTPPENYIVKKGNDGWKLQRRDK